MAIDDLFSSGRQLHKPSKALPFEHSRAISLKPERSKKYSLDWNIYTLSRLKSLDNNKKLILKKYKLKIMRILRSLKIDRNLSMNLAKLLVKCGLSRDEIKLVLSYIRRIILSICQNLNMNVSLDEIGHLLTRLPEKIKMLAISLWLFRNELLHLKRLELKKDEIIRIQRNYRERIHELPRYLNKESYKTLDLDNRISNSRLRKNNNVNSNTTFVPFDPDDY